MTEGNVVDLSVELLQGIREELRTMRGELTQMRGDLAEVRTQVRDEMATRGEMRDGFASIRRQVATLEDETIRGFNGVRRELDATNERLGNFIDVVGDRFRTLERRRPRGPTKPRRP